MLLMNVGNFKIIGVCNRPTLNQFSICLRHEEYWNTSIMPIEDPTESLLIFVQSVLVGMLFTDSIHFNYNFQL